MSDSLERHILPVAVPEKLKSWSVSMQESLVLCTCVRMFRSSSMGSAKRGDTWGKGLPIVC
jgi:hypothetical protein